MRKITIFLGAVCFLFASGFYAGVGNSIGSGKRLIVDNDKSSGSEFLSYEWNFVGGYVLTPNHRFELEYQNSTFNSKKDSNDKSNNYYLGLNFIFTQQRYFYRIKPYGKMGVGYAYSDTFVVKDNSSQKGIEGIGVVVGVGAYVLAYNNCDVCLSFSYRSFKYKSFENISFYDKGSFFNMGVNYYF